MYKSELHLCKPHAIRKYQCDFNDFGTCIDCGTKHVLIMTVARRCIECTRIKIVNVNKKREKTKRKPLHLCQPPPVKKYGKNFCYFGTCSKCDIKLMLLTSHSKCCIKCIGLHISKLNKYRINHLEKLKQNHPEQYQKYLAKHRGYNKLKIRKRKLFERFIKLQQTISQIKKDIDKKQFD